MQKYKIGAPNLICDDKNPRNVRSEEESGCYIRFY